MTKHDNGQGKQLPATSTANKITWAVSVVLLVIWIGFLAVLAIFT